MAVQDHLGISMLPLTMRDQYILRAPVAAMRGVAIDPRGRWIAATAQGSTEAWIWPLSSEGNVGRSTVKVGNLSFGIDVSPTGNLLAASTASGVWLFPLDDGSPRKLPGFNGMVIGAAFDRDGRRVAAGGGLTGPLNAPGETHVRVWNIESGEVQILDARDGVGVGHVQFLTDGRLISSGPAGLRMWDLSTATWTQLADGVARAMPSPDGRYILGLRALLRPGGPVGRAFLYDLREKRARDLPTHGTEVTTLAWHPSSTHVVTGSVDGTVRVGAIDGGEPHFFLGHEGPIWDLAVEPGGRWLASTAEDGTVRTWRMRDGPPLHAQPVDQLLDRLRSLTNYRVVSDPSSASGYRIDFEPFAGWNRPPPTW
jgi:WD40 repeat protein